MKYLMMLSVVLTLSLNVFAREDIPDDFKPHTFADPNGVIAWPMSYRLYAPPVNAGEKLPLVIHLHGAGERGVDNRQYDAAGRLFTSLATQRRHPAFVLAPQCPGIVELITIDGHETFGVRAAKTYDREQGDWQQFDLPIGKYIRGKQTHFVVAASRDKKTDTLAFDIGDAVVHEGDRAGGASVDLAADPLGFLEESKLFDRTQNADGTWRLTGDQDRYGMRVPFEYEVKPTTVLSVRVRVDTTSRFIAVGLDNDGRADAMRWVDTDWESETPHALAAEPTEPMRIVIKLIDKLVAEHAVDPDRIYLSGLSMGGFGVYDLAVRHPGRFAAVLGVCGGGPDAEAARVSHVPMWVFHGSGDSIVSVERSRTWVAALKAAGGDVRYTEYEKGGHNAWDRAYSDDEVPTWLFAQKRSKP